MPSPACNLELLLLAAGACGTVERACCLFMRATACKRHVFWANPRQQLPNDQDSLSSWTMHAHERVCRVVSQFECGRRQERQRGVAAPHSQGDLPAAMECCTLLSFLQLTVGLAAPAVARAVLESRAFAQHQRERQCLNLPPEQGWHARLYTWLADVFTAFECVTAQVAARVASGIFGPVRALWEPATPA